MRIAVIGDVVLDHYVRGVITRPNPETAAPLLDVTREDKASGGAGNVARNVVSLGARADLVSVVGDDAAAEALREQSQAEGYEAHLVVDSSRPTPHKIRYLDGQTHLLRVDREARHLLSSAVGKKLLAALKRTVAHGVDGIIVSDYAKGVITPAVAQGIVTIARKHGLPLGVDAKPEQLKYFAGATFIAPNLKEGRGFLGEGGEAALPAVVAEQMATTLRTVVCLTLGADGIWLCGHDASSAMVSQRYAPAQVADLSGAGDAATVAVLLARLSSATWEEAAEMANAAGGIVVSSLGAVAVTRQELVKRLCS